MLMMLANGIDYAIAVQLSGKITRADMALVLDESKLKLSRYDKIVLLEKIDSFDGVKLAAIVDEFKCMYDVVFSKISKMAVLTDKQWIQRVVSIEDKVFRGLEVKFFALAEMRAATAFLKS